MKRNLSNHGFFSTVVILVLLSACAPAEKKKYETGYAAPFAEGFKVRVGKFKNSMGFDDSRKIKSDVKLEEPVSEFVRGAIISELKQAGFGIGDGNNEISGIIHEMAFGDSRGSRYAFPGTRITFRIRNIVSGKISYVKVYSTESGLGNLSTMFGVDFEPVMSNLRDTIEKFIKDQEARDALTADRRIIEEIGAGNFPEVERLYSFLKNQGWNLDQIFDDEVGNTPLTLAATRGHYLIIQFLLSQGANVDRKNRAARTPLIEAAAAGREMAVRLLISQGATIDTESRGGMTAESAAQQKGNEKIAILIQEQRFIDGIKKGDLHPVMGFVEKKRENINEILAEASGHTPLSLAAGLGQTRIIEYLISKGAGVDERNQSSRTPLIEAAIAGEIAAATLLLSKGANPGKRDREEKTPVDWAMEKKNMNLVDLLERERPTSVVATKVRGDPGSEKPGAAVSPVAVLGGISATQEQIVFNSLQEKLSEFFDLLPQTQFEAAREKAFQELDLEQCTEDQCIRKIQEILQVENLIVLQMIRDGKDTQLSLSLIDLEKKIIKTVYCSNCNTETLNRRIAKLVEKLVEKN